jgi:hypothetical protein
MLGKLIKKIIMLLATVCVMSTASLCLAWGEQDFTVTGGNSGLNIEVLSKAVDTSNLSPGDVNSSSLKLTNTGNNSLTVYIKTNIKEEKSLKSSHLADIMTLAIKDGSQVIVDGLFREVANKDNILIGKMAPGAIKTIGFDTELPLQAGNDYQGATMKVEWIFTTQSTGNNGGDDNGGGNNGGYDPPEKPSPGDGERDGSIVSDPTEPDVITIPEDELPAGSIDIPYSDEVPSEPEDTTVTDEELPFSFKDMPYTGETSPMYFYGAGAAIAMLGIVIRKR